MSQRSSGRGVLRAVLGAVLSAVLTKPASHQVDAAIPARLRCSRGSETSTRSGALRAPADAEDSSPGQFGEHATVDLPAADAAGLLVRYAPEPDGNPDPGEIVWTWVPFEENDGRGKDRPVLILARIDGQTTAGCYLSTKHHSGFISVGTGEWDSQHRESFLAPDRLLRISDEGMRREGHVLDRSQFERVAAVLASRYGFRVG